MTTQNPAIEKYGWTAVPRKVSALLELSEAKGLAPTISTAEMVVPNSPLSQKIHEYAKAALDIEPYHHSMRVYYYGQPNVSTNPSL